MDLPLSPPLRPMLAKATPRLPEEPGLQYDPKWDGFRCIVFRDGDEVELGSRNERPLTRYFPELLPVVRDALPSRCVVDCEILVPTARGIDFEALQQRIHPADSRVRRLATETPATLVVFDLLALDGDDLTGEPLAERRTILERVVRPGAQLLLSPATTDVAVARRWFEEFDGAGIDGVIVKPVDGPYVPGERAWRKVKHAHTADAVVAGFRWAKDGQGVGSLLLGLYDEEGGFHFIGATSSFTKQMQRDLVEEVRPLLLAAGEAHPWGPPPDASPDASPHDAVRRPGPVSRWSGLKEWVALRPERVVEIRYDQLEDGRLRHVARFVRWRPDRDPASCSYAQLEPQGEADPARIFSPEG